MPADTDPSRDAAMAAPESRLPEAQPAPTVQHVNTLDGMRGLAILSVMLAHLLPYDHPLHHLKLHSSVGVSFFFVDRKSVV